MNQQKLSQSTCKRCGTCCKNGGPALHLEDLPLLTNGNLNVDDLITIRRGEPAISPLSGQVEPARKEIIKINGAGNSWTCCFYQDGDSSCGIYEHRPLECRVLKCWDTDALTRLIFRNTLSRLDIIKTGNEGASTSLSERQVLETIARHEQECPYEKLQIAAEMKHNRAVAALDACRKIINTDMAIRRAAIQQYNLSLAEELFYFGRPMFPSLSYYGLD